jgi:hypothetical protein
MSTQSLHVDWIQPFDGSERSICVLYASLEHLSHDERVRTENLTIIGITGVLPQIDWSIPVYTFSGEHLGTAGTVRAYGYQRDLADCIDIGSTSSHSRASLPCTLP